MEELKDKVDFMFEMVKMTFLRTITLDEVINTGSNKMLDLYLETYSDDINYDGNGTNYLLLIINKNDIEKVRIALKYQPSKLTMLLTLQKLTIYNRDIINELVTYYHNKYKDINAFNTNIKKSKIYEIIKVNLI